MLRILVLLIAASWAYAASGAELVYFYTGSGRIGWNFPEEFKFYPAVPHFTSGTRIKCDEESGQSCEIQIVSRSLLTSEEERIRQLVGGFEAALPYSEEKSADVRRFGTRPEVVYVSLTPLKSARNQRIVTGGYMVLGPSILRFNFRTTRRDRIEPFLEMLRATRAIDALEIWAWRFSDFRIACADRVPAYRDANDAAFNSSRFSSVDIEGYFRGLTDKPDAVPDQLRKATTQYVEALDSAPRDEQKDICGKYPDLLKKVLTELQ